MGYITLPNDDVSGNLRDGTDYAKGSYVFANDKALRDGINGNLDNSNIKVDAEIAWSKISKTGSNLTDITTKSHAALSDIGTNTHAVIDTHIANTSIHRSVFLCSKTIVLPEYVEDSVSNYLPILPIEVGAFPYGIVITKFGIKTDANTTYSVVLEDWSDPQTHSADISTVATSASDDAESAALTTTVTAGNIVSIDLPGDAGVKSLQVWFTYTIKAS